MRSLSLCFTPSVLRRSATGLPPQRILGRTSGYHSKVVAYPFTLSPSAALESFAHFPLTPHILNSFDPMKLPEYITKYKLDIPQATEEFALKPDKFSAVYFPAWFVYAALLSAETGSGSLVQRK